MLKNQLEKNKEHYSHFSADTNDFMVEFETVMKDPLKSYDSYTTYLFLSALGDAFKVNVIVFQSNDAKGWVVNLSNEENRFKEILYFARSLMKIPYEKLQRISNVSEIIQL